MFILSYAEKIAEDFNKFQFLYNLKKSEFEYVSPHYDKILGNLFVDKSDLFACIKKEDQAFVSDMYHQFTIEQFSDTVEFSIVTSLMDSKVLRANISSFTNENGEIELIGGLVEDITKRRENEMNNYEYMAKKNALLEILEHEIGGQLSLLKSIASSFTEENVQHNKEKLLDYALSIQNLSKSAMNTISDLVKKELISTLRSPLKKVRVNIVESIRSMFSIFHSSEDLIFKKFNLHTSKEEIFVEVDHIKFMQVLNNLLYNAIKFTHDDGEISINISEELDSVLFSIADNGIGIPEELHATLFNEHTPASRMGLKGEKSHGIGLSIVKKFVEMHDGKIWFESAPQKGTCFYFTIPKR